MIEIRNLNKTFYKNTPDEANIFTNLNLNFPTGQSTAIIGPNGCGKSTLLNMISGSLKQDSGEILVDDILISEMSEEKRANFIGKVNQDPSQGVAPSLTIMENMALALKKGEKFSLKNLLKNTDKELILEKLEGMGLGLENKLNTKVKFLSGGQRQSLSLLMTSLNKPKVLLLDEHTAALDPKTSKITMEKTKALIEKEKMTTIMISHDFEEAIGFSDNIIMLNKGKLAFQVNPKNLTSTQLHDMYNEEVNKHL